MPVLVTASPFDEGTETRIRHRYAVLSALALAGFGPLDNQHLRYYLTPLDEQPKPSQVVPFEWFRRDDAENKRKYVCVVWLSEDVVSPPSVNLGKRLVAIRDAFRKATCQDSGPRFSVLGPANSDMLATLVKEALSTKDLPNEGSPKPSDALEYFTLYSTQATWQESWKKYERQTLVESVKPESKKPGTPRVRLKVGLEIGNDDKLVKILADELIRRGLRPNDRVALLGEWDTEYGRGLVRKFSEQLNDEQQERKQDGVRRYYYMRGLDGILSENIPSNQQPASPKDSSKDWSQIPLRSTLDAGVTASGRSQVDYISRLIEKIRPEGDTLKFIGILGSDVYDKILLMRAIRPIAPQAILFTTDLDARLLDPKEYPSTHNLLIASHFGLTLDDRITPGDQIPPFRDSYQTSLCRGCLHALKDACFLPKKTGLT